MNGKDDPRKCRDEIIDRVRSAIERAGPRELPFITLTYAQSIDGSIAPSDGGMLLLSNAHSQRLTHQARALHDAILVGINTVLNDDPRLNVRLVDGSNPQPVVVDSRLRFPLGAKLLKPPCVPPIVVAGHGEGSEDKERQLVEAGARIVRMPLQTDGSIDLADLLARLKQFGLHSVMVEGGAEVITSVLSSNLADQFLLTIAPRFVGGLRAVKPRDGVSGDRLPRLHNVDSHWLAGDLIVRGDFDPNPNGSAASAEQRIDSPIPSPRRDESLPEKAADSE